MLSWWKFAASLWGWKLSIQKGLGAAVPVPSGAAGSLAPIQPSWALLCKHRGSQTAGGEEFRLLGKMSASWEQDVSPGQIGSALVAWDRQVSWCWGCGKALINEAEVLWRRMRWEWRVIDAATAMARAQRLLGACGSQL